RGVGCGLTRIARARPEECYSLRKRSAGEVPRLIGPLCRRVCQLGSLIGAHRYVCVHHVQLERKVEPERAEKVGRSSEQCPRRVNVRPFPCTPTGSGESDGGALRKGSVRLSELRVALGGPFE